MSQPTPDGPLLLTPVKVIVAWMIVFLAFMILVPLLWAKPVLDLIKVNNHAPSSSSPKGEAASSDKSDTYPQKRGRKAQDSFTEDPSQDPQE